MNYRELCIGINMISGLGYLRYKALCEAFGSPDAIRAAERGELQKIPGIGQIIAERIVEFDWDAELSKELAIADRGNVRITTLADDDYPECLRELSDPPLALYIRGKLPKDFDRSVAIVGSRRVSNYGERMAVLMAEGAAANGFTVVSGLAHGIDTIAHSSVVKLMGRTIGVLGGGLLHMYPKENIPLAREIINCGGAIISEFPLNFPISRHNFPRRNRIVAALSRGVLVVEAGIESGAMITARLALEMGKDVFAVPGRVDNFQAKGCHKLIKEGAALVEDFGDVCLALSPDWIPGIGQRPKEDDEGNPILPPDCLQVYKILKNGEADLEELQEATGMDTGVLLAVLMQLEIKLMVERDSEHYYHLTEIH
ncbi:MAG: DNA-protecting protein DprA [Lentisphaerae bacterium]|nr:DNA-protecting protein DprA [Lentisphaerota bacterium]